MGETPFSNNIVIRLEKGVSPFLLYLLDPRILKILFLHLLVDVLEGELQPTGVDLSIRETQGGCCILVFHTFEVSDQDSSGILICHFPLSFIPHWLDL